MAKKTKELQSFVDGLFAEAGASINRSVSKKKKAKADDGIRIPYSYGVGIDDADAIINEQFSQEQPLPISAEDISAHLNKARMSFNPPMVEEQPSEWGNNVLPILAGISAVIPGENINRQNVVRPQRSFNTKLYGRGSQAIMDLGGSLEGPKKPKKKYSIDDEIPSVLKAKSRWDNNRNFKDIVTSAAKRGNVDPRFLFASSLQEGMNKAALAPDEVSDAWKQNFAFTDEEDTFPVDGFYNYGLDTFGTRYEGLVKKGYLPKDFNKSFKTYDAVNEKKQKIKTAAFRNNEDALVAKAALLRDEMDNVRNYAKKKNINLDNAGIQYFTLAAYNGGLGNAQKMMDEMVNTKTNPQDYISKGMTQYKEVHKNIYPRYQRMSKVSFDDGGSIKKLGYNPNDGGTFEFIGNSHEEGGIDINYMGVPAEVEGNETAAVDSQGNLNIYGNMFVPGTKKKFKTLAKEIGLEEEKANKQLMKGFNLFDSADNSDPFSKFRKNSADLKMQGAGIKMKELSRSKELLAALQDSMLQQAKMYGLDPQAMSKGKVVKAKQGAKLKFEDGNPRDQYEQYAKEAAEKQGIHYPIFKRMILQESGFNPKAKSRKGAIGIAQFMPTTAKEYGITEEQLKSDKPEDIKAVFDAAAKHYKGLLTKNNNDYVLATAAYNGGQGAVEFVKKELGKKKITGDDWYTFMQNRRQNRPSDDKHAWQNETFDYVNNIVSLGDNDFNTQSKGFQSKYYGMNDEQTSSPIVTEKLTFDPLKGATRTPLVTGAVGSKANPNTSPLPSLNYQNPVLPSAADDNQLDIRQLVSEITALATNRTRPVPTQRFEPQLYTPYDVSFQDAINENNANFRAIQQTLAGNPAAIGTLAAQTYAANNKVAAEEFRTNQAIENDVINRNVQTLNDANFKNLGLADTQMVRQSEARSNTRRDLFGALDSITSKVLQNQLENIQIITSESMHDYRYGKDSKGKIKSLEHMGPEATISSGGSAIIGNNNQANATTTRLRKDNSGNVKFVDEIIASPNRQALDNIQIQKNQWRFFDILGRQSRGRRF